MGEKIKKVDQQNLNKLELNLNCTTTIDKVSEPDVFGIMISKVSRNRRSLIEFKKSCNNNCFTSIYDFNTVEEIPISVLKEESVDIVVTSSPYGDSRTTVAYG